MSDNHFEGSCPTCGQKCHYCEPAFLQILAKEFLKSFAEDPGYVAESLEASGVEDVYAFYQRAEKLARS